MRNSKRISKIIKADMNAVIEGVENFNNPKPEIEALAKERLLQCVSCPLFVEEPISWMRVTDERIPELSGKMCDDCGCVLAYKTRQSIIKCDKWLK